MVLLLLVETVAGIQTISKDILAIRSSLVCTRGKLTILAIVVNTRAIGVVDLLVCVLRQRHRRRGGGLRGAVDEA